MRTGWTLKDYERRRRILTRIIDQTMHIAASLGRLRPGEVPITRVEVVRIARQRQMTVFRQFAAKAGRETVRRYWRLANSILDELERHAKH